MKPEEATEKDREAAEKICLENRLVLYIGTFSEENPRPLNPPVPSINGMKAVNEAIDYGRRTAPRDGVDRGRLMQFACYVLAQNQDFERGEAVSVYLDEYLSLQQQGEGK